MGHARDLTYVLVKSLEFQGLEARMMAWGGRIDHITLVYLIWGRVVTKLVIRQVIGGCGWARASGRNTTRLGKWVRD